MPIGRRQGPVVLGGGGDITTGLIRHYKMNEGAGVTTVDAASGYTGTLTDAAIWRVDGVDNNCCAWNGAISNYVSAVGTGMPIGTAARTVTLLVKTVDASVNSAQVLFNYGGDTIGIRMQFRFQETSGELQVATHTYVTGCPYVITVDNLWHLLAFSMPDEGASISKINIYVDGVAQDMTVVTEGNFNTSLTDIRIGGEGAIAGYKGFYDECRVYNRELSSEDHVALWDYYSPLLP